MTIYSYQKSYSLFGNKTFFFLEECLWIRWHTSSSIEYFTIYIRQDVDHHVAASIRAQIDDEIDHAKPKTAILNFSEVDFMDSSGIGLIMGRYKHMAGLDGELKLSSVNGSCKRLLELSGILEIVDIVK